MAFHGSVWSKSAQQPLPSCFVSSAVVLDIGFRCGGHGKVRVVGCLSNTSIPRANCLTVYHTVISPFLHPRHFPAVRCMKISRLGRRYQKKEEKVSVRPERALIILSASSLRGTERVRRPRLSLCRTLTRRSTNCNGPQVVFSSL